MPEMRWETTGSPKQIERRFRVIATGEEGSAVSENGASSIIDRLVTIGPEWNIRVIDLCHDETGEIRTYRSDRLEEIKD